MDRSLPWSGVWRSETVGKCENDKRRIRTFLIVCLSSCRSCARPADRRICRRKEPFNQFPGPLLLRSCCWATFWVPQMAWAPSRPSLLFPRDEESEEASRDVRGGRGKKGVVGEGVVEMWRAASHWLGLRSAGATRRTGLCSPPQHRFLCSQLSRETAKNRLKSLGFWNWNTSVFDRGSPLLEREGRPKRKGSSSRVRWARAQGAWEGRPQGPTRPLSDTLWPTQPDCPPRTLNGPRKTPEKASNALKYETQQVAISKIAGGNYCDYKCFPLLKSGKKVDRWQNLTAPHQVE